MHTRHLITTLAKGLIGGLLLTNPLLSNADCGDSYNLTHHNVTGKLDICDIEPQLDSKFRILTNWGTKPEWLNKTQFAFVSNQIGDIYLMDLETNTVSNLTGHFEHSGFTRVHKLKNGDLLLLGPSSGPQPPIDPLVIYDNGQFTSDLWVLKAPYDEPPVPLNVHAWEGIAVSTESNRIAWSDTRKPFYGKNLFFTGLNYIFARSNLWMGEIDYDDVGTPYINHIEKLVRKYEVGLVFFEPQNFKGENDEQLLFEAYGPTSSGTSDTYIYDFTLESHRKIHTAEGYNEWEGISPDYKKAFVEVDPTATNISGPSAVDLYVYDFVEQELSTIFVNSHDPLMHGFHVHEPVFSPDGNLALMATGGATGNEFNSPGYGIGIVLFDNNATSN